MLLLVHHRVCLVALEATADRTKTKQMKVDKRLKSLGQASLAFRCSVFSVMFAELVSLL
jgi:hypothetical protein